VSRNQGWLEVQFSGGILGSGELDFSLRWKLREGWEQRAVAGEGAERGWCEEEARVGMKRW
jgi:hypothetical protein